jgi:hypothetical protein
VQSLSQRCQKSIQKGKNRKVEYNIYFITLIRVHLFGTCGYKSIRTESNINKTSSSGSMKARETPYPQAAQV